jgi:excisionase family DNA binding protein
MVILALSLFITDYHTGFIRWRICLSEPTERWLRVEEIAAHLGVAPVTIYRYLEKGVIPCHRVGKLWRFKASEVDAWVAMGGAEDGTATTKTKKISKNKKARK